MAETESQLIEKARGGDEAALATLLEQSGLSLHAEIERQIGPKYRGLVDADDILQVTCLEAFLRIRTFLPTNEGAFGAWLRRVAENNLRDAIRELERDKRPPPGKRADWPTGDDSYVAMVDRLSAATSTASRVMARGEVKSAIDGALAQLPDDYATALRLYELDGLTGPEVAEQMGRSHGAVRMLLARARERLAEVIGSDDRFYSKS